MRILKVIHAWPPEGRGGTEAHASQAAHALSARGHQVGVFARTGRPGQPEYEVTTESHNNIGVTRINNTFVDSWSFPWMYKNARVHEAFEREIDEFKPDLVHIHHLTTLSTTIIEAVKSRGLPCVMTLHDFWTACPRGQRMMSDLHLCEDLDRKRCYGCLGSMWPHIFDDQENEPVVVNGRGELSPQLLAEWDRHIAYVLNLCDLLVTPSAFHRERMLELPIAPERIISLPHGMDHAPFEGVVREARPVERIGFIGSVIPVKGVDVLIAAFRKLNRPDLHLDIHGEIQSFHEDGGYEARLRDQARGAANIHFHGGYDADEVPRLLAGIDILAVPSLWWETFCLTIREGMLAGIPVVASDLGAMREALDGEQDGIFFRTGDSDDLAEKLLDLIENDARRARFLNRGAAVKALTDYIGELEDVYASATRISAQRQGELMIAPAFFPESGAPPSQRKVNLDTVPWKDMGVAMAQSGTAAFNVQTRLPTADDPSFSIDIKVTDEDREAGRLDLQVDLSALGDADAGDAAPSPLASAGAGTTGPDQGKKPRRTRRKGKPRPETADESAPSEPPLKSDPAVSNQPDSNGRSQATEEGSMEKDRPRRRKPDREKQRRSSGSTQPEGGERKKATVRRTVRGGRESARREELSGSGEKSREDVPRGDLKTERWSVARPTKTRTVKPDES